MKLSKVSCASSVRKLLLELQAEIKLHAGLSEEEKVSFSKVMPEEIPAEHTSFNSKNFSVIYSLHGGAEEIIKILYATV